MSRAGAIASLPLEQQIRDTERRLAERRRSAGAHLAAAKRRVRAGLNSPLTLLVAFGVGIGLGQVSATRRRRRQAPPAPARAARDAVGAGVLPLMLDVLRLAAPIMALLSALQRNDALTASQVRAGAGGTEHPHEMS